MKKILIEGVYQMWMFLKRNEGGYLMRVAIYEEDYYDCGEISKWDKY